MKSKALERKEMILNVALEMARQVGYQNVRRDALAVRAGVGLGTVNLYYNTIVQLKRAIMRKALTDRDHIVIAQGLAHDDPLAAKADLELKVAAAEWLLR